MVRFENGKPTAYYLSAHGNGAAYTFDAVEKTRDRPTSYIAIGTHANYATTGKHCHDTPPEIELICDQVDAGPIWDPTLNYRAYWYDTATQTFTVAGSAGAGGSKINDEGLNWLNFRGRWGDQQYRILEHGNYCVPINGGDECHYVSGPTGET